MAICAFFAAPVTDYLAALQRCYPGRGVAWILPVIFGLALSWWLYVPLHELLHAAGCELAGGEVTRLEIAPEYGGLVLQHLFPFVTPSSEYAGRLSGFDTHGNDVIYLVTVFFPYLLTLFFGVLLLRLAASAQVSRPARCLLLGGALPIAYAPFVSLPGDYYEMGSIIVSRGWSEAAVQRWRSDDLFKLMGGLFSDNEIQIIDVVGISMSAVVGILLAFLTYWLGVQWARS